MSTNQYLVLLRGINVGGRNIVSMADLRAAFETEGYGNVSTYIQSGNVLLESDAPRASLEHDIQSMLERRLAVAVVVVVRSLIQLRNVVSGAPDGFGQDPDRFDSDVAFLKAPLSSKRAMRVVDGRDGVDRVWPGTGVLYLARLSARRTESRLSRMAGTPEYRQMTIRNWNTTTKLLTLLEGRREKGAPAD